MLKRKFVECSSDDATANGESEEDSNCSSVQTDGSTDVATGSDKAYSQPRKKAKKSVSFDGVTVYYFQRKQGFTCVPSQGGSTLGMSEKHSVTEKFSLGEYTQVQRLVHHQLLLDQHEQGKILLPPDKLFSPPTLQREDSSENGSEVGSDDSDDDFCIDDYYFLQPVTTRQRRMLLRQSGVKKIEPVEKDECKEIRSSREVCGCNCKVFCDPETCICNQAGIKCQVDRLAFPCGCSKDGCGNQFGRIEFNPIRVRTHFIHTLMRLEMERKRELEQQARGCFQRPPVGGSTAECSSQTAIRQQSSTKSCSVSKDEPQPAPSSASKASVSDMSRYNSNELGSCRDCQKTDLGDILRESPFTSSGTDIDSCLGQQPGRAFSLPEEPHLGLPNVTNPGESLPQVTLFSDDEDTYNAENTTAMFHFPKEESSYSESSDCSSEGGTSPDEQLAYSAYNYSTFDSSTNSDKPSKDGCEDLHSSSTCAGSSPGNLSPQPSSAAVSSYSSSTPDSPGSSQKYLGLNTSPTHANGYKLEPISEILSPIRYPGYQEGPNSSSSGGWEADSFSKVPNRGLMSGSRDQPDSQYLYPNCGDSPSKPRASPGPASKSAPQEGPLLYKDYPGFSEPYSCHADSTSHDKPTDPSPAESHQDSQPRYHELKSTSQQSAEGSLVSSFFSSANQVSTSFDLANQKPGGFHLATSPSCGSSPSSEMEVTGSADIYALPSAQTAQPVTTFDLPNESPSPDQSESREEERGRSPSPTPDSSTAQNFGEIIKESIVETVSA